ncbi:MAG: penicillin-binding transpeptidase domain-containing protein [Lachnospira eligens]
MKTKIATIDAAVQFIWTECQCSYGTRCCHASSSLINDGKYYQPHIVKGIESANGEVVKENSPVLVRQTVTASTSKYLRKYLENTVELVNST